MNQSQARPYRIEDISDDTGQWREAVAFLETFPQAEGPAIPWLQRFEHWWRTNPAADPLLPRGWLLRNGSEVVGFNGVIAFDYVLRGTTHKALAMTTWMVHPDHRAQSMKLFHKFHALRHDHILVNTTANNDVRKVFSLMKYQCAADLHSFLFFLRPRGYSALGLGLWAARLAFNRGLGRHVPHRIIGADGLDGVTGELRQQDGALAWRMSLEQLKWLCRCPATHEKGFIGALNERGELTAYMICLKHRFRGTHPYLSVIDAYWRDDRSALLGLVRHVCDHPDCAPLAQGCAFIALNTFDPASLFPRRPVPCVHRQSYFPHFYHLPPHLSGAPRRFRLAEGDVGC